jgi:hypothetical protein
MPCHRLTQAGSRLEQPQSHVRRALFQSLLPRPLASARIFLLDSPGSTCSLRTCSSAFKMAPEYVDELQSDRRVGLLEPFLDPRVHCRQVWPGTMGDPEVWTGLTWSCFENCYQLSQRKFGNILEPSILSASKLNIVIFLCSTKSLVNVAQIYFEVINIRVRI